MPPVVALLTDFGSRDHYAGAMKGVVLRVCPDARLVDITHDIGPGDILDGALGLAASYRYFPPGTVFLAVVDPGVGSARRPIAAAAGEFRFVAPDNGLISLALDEIGAARVVELADARYRLPVVSRTFHGRDLFAPAAAWLARGVTLEELGPSLEAYERLALAEPRTRPGAIEGEVLRVDRFGNLVSNIRRTLVERAGEAGGRPARVVAGETEIGPIVATYADVARGAFCALVGSSDRLEVSINGGSAAEALGLARGSRIRLTW